MQETNKEGDELKDKIKYFSKGDFQIQQPDIVFPETSIICKISEGEIYQGSFMIENTVDGDIRGLVYSSSFRMHCKNSGFQGNPIKIDFEYDGTGLEPGYVEKGAFTIVCNGGEYEIAYSVIIERLFVMTSQGKVQDLQGFKKLAYKDFEEAKRVFKSRDFYQIIKYEQPKVRNLYVHMRKWNLEDLGLEEFLVGIKQKEKLFFMLDGKERLYKNIESIYSDSVTITKNTWGYLKCKIYSDCDFIEPAIEELSSLEFQGMSYELQYTIKNTQLHGGRNFGRLIIETAFDKIIYTIEVDNGKENTEDRRKEDYIKAYLLKNTLHLEGGYIAKDKWLEKAIQLINELEYLNPEKQEYKLYQAQAYLKVDQHEEARWILESYSYSKFPVGRDLKVDALYLYLMALEKRDSSYTKKVIDEIQKIYMKFPQSWPLLNMLIELDPFYKDSYEKKKALESYFLSGANHLSLYLKGFQCFKEKPANLKKLGNFEIQVLRFALKYNLMTKEVALYTANLGAQLKWSDKRILQILEKSYKVFPEEMILTSICTLLIKGNETNNVYYKWYELAINEDLKIAKLFEYYMASVDQNMQEPLPRTVLLYFAHGSNLPYEKLGLLYANIIRYENESSELFKLYEERIKIFTMQQLELRKISSNLSILYRKYLSVNEMNVEKIKAIYNITHSYQLTTTVPNIKYVLVISEDGAICQRAPYLEKGSQVVIDSIHDMLVWESTDGTYYVGSVKYKIERLFNEKKYIEMCEHKLRPSIEASSQKEVIPLNFENLYQYDLSIFDSREVLKLCSDRLKEETVQAEDFLSYILFWLFKKEEYDKRTLKYLTDYYCGSTRTMKEIWYAAQDYDIETKQLSERIITQMLFVESLLGEETIFEDYFNKGAYFRIEEAYMSYISREYVVKHKIISEKVVRMIMNLLCEKQAVADVIKIAMLKYFSTHTCFEGCESVLKQCMQELCEKQMYFDFYMQYSEDWLREVQLWDKTLVSYTAKFGGEVKLIYRLQTKEQFVVEQKKERLVPIFETVYVKKFLVFKEEILQYYFTETLEDRVEKSEVITYRIHEKKEFHGRFGRLNEIIGMPEARDEMMMEYALEDALSRRMFDLYE